MPISASYGLEKYMIVHYICNETLSLIVSATWFSLRGVVLFRHAHYDLDVLVSLATCFINIHLSVVLAKVVRQLPATQLRPEAN